MVKYIGSKRALLPWIVETIETIRTIEHGKSGIFICCGSKQKPF